MDPDPDPKSSRYGSGFGSGKSYGSGSTTLVKSTYFYVSHKKPTKKCRKFPPTKNPLKKRLGVKKDTLRSFG
jgi:hypothetical protein